ncbi:MAG: trigger factor [Rikenellaceae bacterium]
MNIVREQLEGGVSLLKVEVAQADYAASVEKSLRDFKKKANVPGFRPGMVPMGVIKKMYGKGVLAEQTYQTASTAVYDYLKSEKIEYLGDVIPSDKQGDFDFDNGTDFEFIFEIGEAPAFNLELNKERVVEYKSIAVNDDMRKEYRTNFLRRFGRLQDVEEVTSDEAISGTLDNSEINVEDAYVGLISMSEEERAPFIGKKVGDKMSVNVNDLYKTASQRAAILQCKEEELDSINPEFEFEITKIRKFADPEMNEEFFATAFPDGNITSEEQLSQFFEEQIAMELRRESDFLFVGDMRKYLVAEAGLQMPVEFLKRWLMVINEGKFSMEDIEKDFEAFLTMYTWNYIQRRLIEANDIKIEQEEAIEEAKNMAQAQFAQYGMPAAPAEMLENYAQQILSTKEQAQRIYEKLYESKVVAAVKEQITVNEKPLSVEEFAAAAQAL